MDWTPESLARAFHEAYGRVAAERFGHAKEPEPWEALPEGSRALMVDACADLLGVEVVTPPAEEAAPVAGSPVPTREEFKEAAETAPGDGAEERGDWYADLQRQIENINAPQIRRAFRDVREPFRK
jgi:hypothetical protein